MAESPKRNPRTIAKQQNESSKFSTPATDPNTGAPAPFDHVKGSYVSDNPPRTEGNFGGGNAGVASAKPAESAPAEDANTDEKKEEGGKKPPFTKE